MKAFKINMTNQMRSMDLDHLLKESYIPPDRSEADFEKYFCVDNKFLYSAVVEIMTNPNHPARSWLMTEEIENDGRAAYFKLINHYDNETIEDSHGITAYMRWTNTKLTGVHLGAMKVYITKYQTFLSDIKEARDTIPDNPAKDMFLAHIKPDEYQQVTINCKTDKVSLSECMERCLRVAVSVEANAASRSRRAAKTYRQQSTVSTTTATASTGSVAGRPKTYKGKAMNEYGSFKDRNYWTTMTANDKTAYFKQLDKWVQDGLILRKSKGLGASSNRKAVLKELMAYMRGAITNDTGSNQSTEPPTSTTSDSSNNDVNEKMIRFLNSRMSIARRFRCGINGDRLNAALKDSPCNAVCDSGTDTCLLGSAFKMLRHSDRMATVSGFDENLIIDDMKIGTGVTAFDKPDGETILVMVNEGIDHTSQDNTLLANNQMRHNGVDVSETHQKFISKGTPGEFRLAKGGHELPFTMENSLASLAFRYPTDAEVEDENIKVVLLTSEIQWDPENLCGNDFLPGADMHYARKNANHISDEVILDGDSFYDTSDSHSDDDSSVKQNVTKDRFLSATQKLQVQVEDTTAPLLTVVKTASTQPRAGPETTSVDGPPPVSPPDNVCGDDNLLHLINKPIVRIKDSSCGHSQDFIYDSLDQYAWHELDPSAINSPSMDKNQIWELEKWIKEIPHRKAIVRSRSKDEDWNHWQRCLAWFPLKVIKKARDATTNYAYTEYDSGNMRRHKKSQSPVSPKNRPMESFWTDTFFAEEKALGGDSCVQIFCGSTSYFTWLKGMKTEFEGPSALRDFIRQVGVPFSLRNNNSKLQTGKAFMDICNFFTIGTETTEPHHPHQNPAENRIGTVKLVANRVMDRSGCPSNLWLRAFIFHAPKCYCP